MSQIVSAFKIFRLISNDGCFINLDSTRNRMHNPTIRTTVLARTDQSVSRGLIADRNIVSRPYPSRA
jgi:hypothetical protein